MTSLTVYELTISPSLRILPQKYLTLKECLNNES